MTSAMATIGIIDLGIGNINSVQKALKALGVASRVSAHPEELTDVDKLILPGVGSFSAAALALKKDQVGEKIQHLCLSKPLLGICVGMQIMATVGEEHGENPGLDLVPGRVALINTTLPLPHVGWNNVMVQQASPLFYNIPQDSCFYFTHSFAFASQHEKSCLAVSDYGGLFTSVVAGPSLWGVQFHPEKSQAFGLQLLRNFVERCE